MMDNIIASKLYRAGSVGYVSKSGGMSNELNNVLSLITNGVYKGNAIGGDRYPGTTFIDHLLRYKNDPECKMLVLLGEVGGIEEYRVIDAVKKGIIKKPIVAWAIGACAKMFVTEVLFGHAGSMANSDMETADAKNNAMRAAGFVIPDTFEEPLRVLKAADDGPVANGTIKPQSECEPPVIPVDYKWAQELGLIHCFHFHHLQQARSRTAPVCVFWTSLRKILVLVVWLPCCSLSNACRHMPRNSLRWFSCSLLITARLCLAQ
jgi:ATP citrate (pro-S)-lyase